MVPIDAANDRLAVAPALDELQVGGGHLRIDLDMKRIWHVVQVIDRSAQRRRVTPSNREYADQIEKRQNRALDDVRDRRRVLQCEGLLSWVR